MNSLYWSTFESEWKMGFPNWFVLYPAVRKRSRKDNDRAWEYEEHESRRGTGSRSRYGDRSPDASDRESPPPPSLSDGQYILQTPLSSASRIDILCV